MTPAGEGEVGAAHLAHRHSVVRHPHGGRGTQRRRQDRNVGGTRREGRRPGPEVLDGGADGFNPVDTFTHILSPEREAADAALDAELRVELRGGGQVNRPWFSDNEYRTFSPQFSLQPP